MTTNIGSTATDYKEQLKKLSPEGKAWPIEDDSNWVRLLDAIAQECARIDAMGVLLIDESFPDTTTLLLENWERVLGLPDECSELGESTAIRRLNVLSKIASRGGQTPQYYINIAAGLGYTITITEFNQFRVGISSVGDPLYGEEWEHAWQVNAPLNSIIEFKVGQSAVGDALREWGNDRLECVMNKLKPAHTVVIFSYT
jgi:uncharacterized protein YmfQ (DUF2313 family)